MTDIVQFPKAEKQDALIWVCHCGCTSFTMFSDGSSECAACEQPVNRDDGGWLVPDTKKMHEGATTYSDIQGNGSVEFARNRMSQRALEPGCKLVVLAFEDGSTSAWSSAETQDQMNWVREKLDIGHEILSRGIENVESANKRMTAQDSE